MQQCPQPYEEGDVLGGELSLGEPQQIVLCKVVGETRIKLKVLCLCPCDVLVEEEWVLWRRLILLYDGRFRRLLRLRGEHAAHRLSGVVRTRRRCDEERGRNGARLGVVAECDSDRLRRSFVRSQHLDLGSWILEPDQPHRLPAHEC